MDFTTTKPNKPRNASKYGITHSDFFLIVFILVSLFLSYEGRYRFQRGSSCKMISGLGTLETHSGFRIIFIYVTRLPKAMICCHQSVHVASRGKPITDYQLILLQLLLVLRSTRRNLPALITGVRWFDNKLHSYLWMPVSRTVIAIAMATVIFVVNLGLTLTGLWFPTVVLRSCWSGLMLHSYCSNHHIFPSV